MVKQILLMMLLFLTVVGCTDKTTVTDATAVAEVEYTLASTDQSVILTDEDLDAFSLIRSESIGGLKVGMVISEFISLVPCRVTKSEPILWEGIGEIIQEWHYDECGVNVQLSTVDTDVPQVVSSITIESPSDFKTAQGVGLGSTEEAVFEAYEDQIDPTVSELGETVVAGSIYGGLIFTFKEGQVVKMFLGGGAE